MQSKEQKDDSHLGQNRNDPTWKGLVPGIYNRLSPKLRAKRIALFLKMFPLSPEMRILDLGGMPGFWSHVDTEAKVVCLNLEEAAVPEELRHRVRSISGDACELPEFDENFDIIFSNSVIEHVGNLDRQRQFADSVRSAGVNVFVQTPAKACPIEPHWFTLFLHWFPRSWRYRLYRFASLRHILAGKRLSTEEIRKIIDSTRLLNKREMKQLFPDCEIHTERLFFVIPKAYIAIRAGKKAGEPE